MTDETDRPQGDGSDGSDVADSNPNAAGPQGLKGGMGVSSERTGPDDHEDRSVSGGEGTGTVGSALTEPEGRVDTSPEQDTGQTHPDEAEMDESANPRGVTPQPFDPRRNPGHSHG